MQSLILANGHVDDWILDKLIGRNLKYLGIKEKNILIINISYRSLVNVPRKICRGKGGLGATIQIQILPHGVSKVKLVNSLRSLMGYQS